MKQPTSAIPLKYVKLAFTLSYTSVTCGMIHKACKRRVGRNREEIRRNAQRRKQKRPQATRQIQHRLAHKKTIIEKGGLRFVKRK